MKLLSLMLSAIVFTLSTNNLSDNPEKILDIMKQLAINEIDNAELIMESVGFKEKFSLKPYYDGIQYIKDKEFEFIDENKDNHTIRYKIGINNNNIRFTHFEYSFSSLNQFAFHTPYIIFNNFLNEYCYDCITEDYVDPIYYDGWILQFRNRKSIIHLKDNLNLTNDYRIWWFNLVIGNIAFLNQKYDGEYFGHLTIEVTFVSIK